MAISIALGGKDPEMQRKKRLAAMPKMIGASSGPKSATAPSPSTKSAPSIDPDETESAASEANRPKQGESQFHDQNQVCSKCEYFDQAGMGGVGECKMGVPEADFSTSDPDSSWCKYFEASDEPNGKDDENVERLAGGEVPDYADENGKSVKP